jgi:hypothetical protein
MSKKRQSKFSPGKKVSEFQYAIELVLRNLAKKKKVDLPLYFWNDKEWKKHYLKELRFCSKLAKKHGYEKLINFIVEKHIYSLSAKWIDDALSNYSYQIKVESGPEQPQVYKESLAERSKKKIRGFDKL